MWPEFLFVLRTSEFLSPSQKLRPLCGRGGPWQGDESIILLKPMHIKLKINEKSKIKTPIIILLLNHWGTIKIFSSSGSQPGNRIFTKYFCVQREILCCLRVVALLLWEKAGGDVSPEGMSSVAIQVSNERNPSHLHPISDPMLGVKAKAILCYTCWKRVLAKCRPKYLWFFVSAGLHCGDGAKGAYMH